MKLIKLYRNFLMCFVFSVFGVGSLIVGLLIFPLIDIFYKKQDKKLLYSKIIHTSWNIFLNLMMSLKIMKINIKDYEKIKNIKQSVIVSTHPSYIDVVILIALIPNTTCFTAPKISRNPFFKNIAKSMFLVSGCPVEEIVSSAKEALDKGFNVLIFPMGTRHRKNEFLKIRKGASQIAIESKKDIVSLKLTTDKDFLQTHQPFYDAGESTVTYDLSYIKTIKTTDFLEKEKDEVNLRKKLTEEIKCSLYN